MSPERIVGEIQLLKERYGARAFHLVHDNLTVRKPFVADIARLLRERSVDVRWGFSSRIDTIDQATIQAVTAAGCDYIFFGIESGSARTQKTIRKRLRLERIREVLHQCVEHGIAPTTSFILGFPDEDAEDIAATVRLAFECRVLGARRSFINLLSPHTGTPLMREQRDRLVFRQEEANSTMVSFLEPHHVELIASDRYIFAGYYSLDYAGSPLTARQYGDLVDFYTICLFRSRFTVAYLLDQLGIDPLSLFRAHDTEMQSLDVDARNALDVQLTLDDLSSGLPQEARSSLSIMQLFDDALWRVTTSQASSLFSGPLEMGQPGMGVRARPGESPSHYLLSSVSDEEVHVDRLTASLSDLYELQGMPALRWQPPAASKHDAVR